MNRYTRAFSSLLEGIEPLCQHYGKGKTFFLCDALWAYIKYGVTPNEYLGFQFYRFSHLERARFYTARISYKYEKHFNDAKYYNTFWQKEKTNEKFQRFVKRDWLYAPTASDEDISHFLKNHESEVPFVFLQNSPGFCFFPPDQGLPAPLPCSVSSRFASMF